MAVNIFEKFGVKEVANVYFEALEDNNAFGEKKGDIVLFLDTLKVSSIETTAENVAAQGGWGNPKLVMWDYGKEINLTLEDALLSLESARIMLGGKIKKPTKDEMVTVHYTGELEVKTAGTVPAFTGVTNPSTKNKYLDADLIANADGIRFINMTQGYRGIATLGESNALTLKVWDATLENGEGAYVEVGAEDSEYTVKANDRLRFFWAVDKQDDQSGNTAVEITISPDTFPGTYKIVGDTFMRNTNGKDYPFQFVINKAKVLSEVTLTMEAEGDPSTFEMQINVLRDESGEMMKMIRYAEPAAEAEG